MYALVLIAGLFVIFIVYIATMCILEKISNQLDKDITRLNYEIDDLSKRMDKDLIGGRHMNIKDLFERKCINAHRAIDRNGRPRAVLYRHPDLYQWAKDSYEKGEEYFYVSHPDPENPYHIVLGEPEYRWFLKNRDGLTDEEYKELCDESEKFDRRLMI